MTSIDSLPSGWAATTLGEIRADRGTSVDPSKSPDEEFALYSIPAYPSGHPERAKGQDIGSTKQSLAAGTVIVSKINPRINRVWVVRDSLGLRQIGSSEWIPFFPVGGLDPDFLAYYLRQDEFRNYLAANVSGVGGSLMRVRPTTVDPYPLVLAPAAEQCRIVAALESYFTRLDDSVATLERVQRNLERYRASVLKAAVEGRLVATEAALARAEGRDYEPASVLLERILAERRRQWEEDELAKMKAAGREPKNNEWKSRYKAPANPTPIGPPQLPEGWCWASPGQVFSWSSGAFLPKASHRPGAYAVYGGHGVAGYHDQANVNDPTIVVGRVGAHCGNVQLTDGPAWITDNAIYATTRSKLAVLPFWRLVLALQDLNANAGGTGQPYVNQTHLNSAIVPLPPLAEQLRIVETIESLLVVQERVLADVVVVSRRCMRLRQAVLKYAFDGRLADQEQSDEPAVKLLERIRAERQSAMTDKPKRTSRRKAQATA